jgi:CBS domain-containing protein
VRIDALLSVITARLATIPRDAPFRDAARLFGAGAFRMLVVCENDGRAVGIVTRTDALRHVAEHQNPLAAKLADVMIGTFTSAQPSDDLLATWHGMAEARFNHLPVLDDGGKPMGTLTADDALKALLEAEEYEETLLRDYIAGLGYR